MSKNIGGAFFVIYVVLVTTAGMLVVEFVSRKINLANGVDIPFLTLPAPVSQSANAYANRHETKSVIDPHLGFARGKNETRVKELQEQFTWIEGFAIYSKKPLTELDHPVILALGGSTTDAARGDNSWPEELSKLLSERGMSATVVNGGTSGYTTNQELLKLVRDGLEFEPDIIISYSGVNDRGKNSGLPYPMVHTYQRYLLEFLTRSQYFPIFPNTVYLMRKISTGKPSQPIESTLGVPSRRTLGQQYEKNLVLMDAIARVSGATFYGIIQPNAYVGPSGESRAPQNLIKPQSVEYVSQLQDLYRQIVDLPARHPFVHSFLSILEGEGLYKKDGVHATLQGNQLIAERVLDLILPELSARQTSEGPTSAPVNQ
jgi:lysophospholipase L1-like esterase